MYIHIYVYTYIYIYVCVYIYTCIYMHIDKEKYSYTNRQARSTVPCSYSLSAIGRFALLIYMSESRLRVLLF